MNALTVEQAWKTAAAEIYAPLSAYCGSSGEVLPNDDPVVVFLCEECEHKAGPYWTALMRIEVDAPALAPDALLPYSAAWQRLLDWLENKASVVAAFAGVEGVNLNGYFVRTSGQGMQETRWVCSIVVVAGVQKAA